MNHGWWRWLVDSVKVGHWVFWVWRILRDSLALLLAIIKNWHVMNASSATNVRGKCRKVLWLRQRHVWCLVLVKSLNLGLRQVLLIRRATFFLLINVLAGLLWKQRDQFPVTLWVLWRPLGLRLQLHQTRPGLDYIDRSCQIRRFFVSELPSIFLLLSLRSPKFLESATCLS